MIAVLTATPALPVYRELEQAAARAGVELMLLDATRATARLAPPGVLLGGDELDPGSLDAFLPRVGNWRPESTLAVVEALQARGVASLNPATAIRVGRDHWLTGRALTAVGLPHPETVAGSDPEALASAAAAVCGFPCVVKQRRSRQGIGVVRCHDRAALDAVLDSLWRLGDEVVVQRFCAPGGVSRRLLVVDGRVVAASEHRAAAGDFRANAARGGTVRAVEPPAAQVELAVAAAAVAGLGLAGVDLLPDGDGDRWVIGEINPTPGWKHLAAATGVPIADHLIAALGRLGGQP